VNGGTATRIAAQQFRNGENVVAGLRPGHRPRRGRTGCAVEIVLPNSELLPRLATLAIRAIMKMDC